MRGVQCPKSLYLTIHHPEAETPITAEQEARFEQGHEVGVRARSRFPAGVLVENPPWDFIGSLKKTRELLASQTEVIFEAAFEYKGLYARADILVFSKETGRWSVFEVKSSLKVKPEQIEDLRLQTWIMVQCGLPLEKLVILHLNPECVHPHLETLFVEVDVTEKIREGYKEVRPRLQDFFSLLKAQTPPEADLGPHCDLPYPCHFKAHCWREKKIPAMSVFQLPQIQDRLWDLYRQGLVSLQDPRLPNLSGLTELQRRVVEVTNSGVRVLNPQGIAQALAEWKFPLVFLDFETLNPALPQHPGARPYSHVPFQFSAHVWRAPDNGKNLEHFEYLQNEAGDPRAALVETLLQACGEKGSIVAYYGKFEKDRLQELADWMPDRRESLLALASRIVDPLPILRENVYDREFYGSFSLKKVAPALLGTEASYENLSVADGLMCQRAFAQMMDAQTPAGKKEELRKAILQYCRQDTWVLVCLTRWMLAVSGASLSSL